MAGDPNLGRGGRHASHDPEDLLVWMEWFTRFRLFVPIMLVPAGYAVHRLLGTPRFDLGSVLVVSTFTLPITILSFVLLRSWRHDARNRVRELERLASAQTVWDIVFTAAGVHFAGGAGGPFWPFPFVPVMVAAALLPTVRALALHSAVAIVATALSAWSSGAAEVMAPLLLGVMFLSFSALVTAAVSRRIATVRAERQDLSRLRGEKEMAEAIARRREEILSVVSHELASPLTTLRGYVRLLKEAKGRDRGNVHLIERVDRQAARIAALADDLLEMASSSTGALRLRRASLDLVEQLREVIETIRVQYPDADVQLRGAAHVVGAWDRDRLDQLFGNLLANAMKFAGSRCRVEVEVEPVEDREVHVRITDDGPGISAEALGRIFEPFQRYSTERGGLGLGLAIARTIVELHAGRIWAESGGDRGAVFHVVLPTRAAPSEDVGVAPVAVPVPLARGSG